MIYSSSLFTKKEGDFMKRGKIILIAAIASVIIAVGSLIYITVNDKENDVSHLEASTVVSIDNTTQSEETKKTEEENTKKEDNKIKEANEADKKKTENKAASAGKITGSMVNADGMSREEETSADKEENTQIKPEQVAEQKVQTTEATTQESYTESDTTETVNAECNHNWVEQTKEVNIPEKGHNERVCVETAWDEPIEEEHVFCYCGFDMTAANMDADEHWASMDYECGGSYTQWVTVGTVHHDAVYEDKWVVDEAAHTETQVTGYKCSKCGATK